MTNKDRNKKINNIISEVSKFAIIYTESDTEVESCNRIVDNLQSMFISEVGDTE